MIQRQQTLWLLLAFIAGLLSFMFPFATGKAIVEGLEVDKHVYTSSNILLVILNVGSISIAAVTIFLYKNRKQQMKLCLAGILAGIAIIALFVLEMNKLQKATPALFSVLPFVATISFYLAWRNIRKDEKLIKSLDKLR